jgi:hypothetical protein
MMTKRFSFSHIKGPEGGFILGLGLFNHVFAAWLGYGKPVWWKPRFMGRGSSKYGFGFGWLLLCFRVQIYELEE